MVYLDGVSGLPESFLSQVAQTDGDYLEQITEHRVPRACDSIWIFFQGKSIRLAFLSFGKESELKGYVKTYTNIIIQVSCLIQMVIKLTK